MVNMNGQTATFHGADHGLSKDEGAQHEKIH